MDKKQFMLLMLIPATILLVFLGAKFYTAYFGQEIILKTAPVDPRDLFRGDYVRLSYDISRIGAAILSKDGAFSEGETIYAILSKKDKFWTIDSISHARQELFDGQVCLKGTVTGVYRDITVQWGIESYFVPEGKGRPIESQRNSGDVSVAVSVDSNCAAVIKELLINDEPVKFE